MCTNSRASQSKRPQIRITESDYNLVAALALGLERSSPALSRQILDEIDRAVIHVDGELPNNVVSIGREIEFIDEAHGSVRRVTLVPPGEANIEDGKVSIMTSVGAGLIGLAEGQSIDWPCPDGRVRKLKVVAVH